MTKTSFMRAAMFLESNLRKANKGFRAIQAREREGFIRVKWRVYDPSAWSNG
jgi:hypothetical protein